jgi:hypothetical protein
MMTFTRKIVNPLDLRVEDIDIKDIAHHLALANRFAGATDFPIPVAQHCVHVSRLCEPYGVEAAFQGLFHDAAEAYLGDMTKWLKKDPSMEAYRKAEAAAQRVIYTAFGLPEKDLPCVKEADDLMVRFEAEVGFDGDFHFDDTERYPPVSAEENERVCPWTKVSWQKAEEMFLQQAALLSRWGLFQSKPERVVR